MTGDMPKRLSTNDLLEMMIDRNLEMRKANCLELKASRYLGSKKAEHWDLTSSMLSENMMEAVMALLTEENMALLATKISLLAMV